MKNKVIETERLILEPVSKKHAAFFFELYNSPKFIEYIGDRHIKTVEDAERYIEEKVVPPMEKFGYGNYLITRKSDDAKIGAVGIFARDGLDVQDIGFSFLPNYEGFGYAYESAAKVLEMAKHEFRLKKICAITTKTNFSSQKLLEKLGLKYIKGVSLPNEEIQLSYYEIEL